MVLKRLRILIIIGFVLISMAGLISCSREQEPKKIIFEEDIVLEAEEELPEKNPIRIAIGSMMTPKEGYAYYKHLLNYIGEKMGRPVKLIDREKYAEIIALLKTGYLDIAFVCSKPYVDGHKEFGLELLVVPQVNGKTEYYSYIIVPVDSPVKTFEELRGKTFAFTDPGSNTGKLVPAHMLFKMNETPDSFFKEYIFTYDHDKSIKAVAKKIVDGASVDSLIWDYYNKFNPELTSKTKIILKSPPYGITPVVVPPGLDPEIKNKLRKIFLDIHKDEEGKKILEGMMIDKFVAGNDASYNSIRGIIASMEPRK
ncbi:MAG: phosphate/phosphite/phosphonate ABC transporter substrate-binding protein [Thermodesulfovibrionia bacterium]|nr:phosphate/phosphite/phosphonate ABC transporter substrate-binding protein [Thermodesulfovibrionia bacterium]